ncbi:MAG: pyrroloquinoline quinone biosynthesis protein PqqE [Methylobacteriaceae bacterium]|nr:pyrroloquinoline quinone biosynthesis protein PqqE [Methylobacteriaceae bacterium]
MNAPLKIPVPAGMLAELTHRCPLGCPYCSNPLELEKAASELDTATWKRVLSEAAQAGVLHVHLSGGEPCSRRDIVEIVAHCAEVGLYSNLITSAVGLNRALFDAMVAAGLDHIQLSIQDCELESADRIAGYDGAFARKREVAAWTVEAGLPLTVNAVMHRANIANAGRMVEFAIALGARRIEVAHTQYYGWAMTNRAALMPSRAATEKAVAEVEALRKTHEGAIVIDHVVPDYHARFPKACMNGWGQRTLNVTPSGKILPCHAAETIPGLEFWNVRDHSIADAWYRSPAFNAFRGTDWMKEPCRSCDRREVDFGGCRCQALALTGDAANPDPICHKSPHHHIVAAIAAEEAPEVAPDYVYRRMKAKA